MAKLSQLLLFDPDPSGLETLTYVFEKDGCSVGGTGDVARARALIEDTSSSLVLVALRDPEQTGLDLIRATTSNPRTRNIACLAIGPAKSRGGALQAGAFGYLSSPLFVRDVLDASKLVAAATSPGSRPSPDTEVDIALGEIGGIYYLIRALAACGRSAAVAIQRGSRRGELRFIEGNLSSVQLAGLSGLSALHHLLLWEDADLRLKFRNVVRRGGQLSLKNEEVIEECDRFLRDFAHEVKDLGVARTVYRPSGRAVQPTAALPSEVVPLLRLFDGQRDLARILDESPFRLFDTLRVARQFIAAGAVVADRPIRSAGAESPASGGPAALDPWFERGIASLSTLPAVGETKSSASALASADGSARPSSPFVKIVSSRPEPQRPPGAAATDRHLGPNEQRTRTITQREHPVETPNTADVATPPAGLSTKPAVATASGEIQVTPFLPQRGDRPLKPSAPSVLVDIAVLPTPEPIVADTPPPLTTAAPPARARAMSLPPAAAPLPVIANIAQPVTTPAPVTANAAQPVTTPAPVTANAAQPVTPAPLPANAAAPSASPPNAHAKKISGAPSHHRSRTPSNGFSAVEADFFNREADLYKGESVETFDDLENGAGGSSPEALRKDWPARKR